VIFIKLLAAVLKCCNVTCACGNTWETGSTLSELKLDICDKCHPFFSGKDKKVDRGGRLERFKKRAELNTVKAKSSSSKTKKKATRASKKASTDTGK